MSRTYRRKKSQWSMQNYELTYYINGYWERVFIEKNSKEYHQIKVNFQKDSKVLINSAPGWFINLCREKSMRQKTKRVIFNWMKNPDKSDCLVPKFTRDAFSYWD